MRFSVAWDQRQQVRRMRWPSGREVPALWVDQRARARQILFAFCAARRRRTAKQPALIHIASGTEQQSAPIYLCVACGKRPRLATLSRCKSCLQADAERDHELAWGKNSNGVANSTAAAPLSRKRCKTCKSDKPLDAFGHHGLVKDSPTLNRLRPSRSRRSKLHKCSSSLETPTPPSPIKRRVTASA